MPPKPELLDHIGWDLARAVRHWKTRFRDEMVARGYAWYGEARGGLIQYIGRDGTPQSALTELSGMSKQAVQQHLDDLERDGIIERADDACEARRKLIRFTETGNAALEDGNRIKKKIEREYRHLIGAEDMAALKRSLKTLVDSAENEGRP